MISAIILAAGESKRMGNPKMLLPWAQSTVLGQVILSLKRAGINEILVVTGAERNKVEKLTDDLNIGSVFNADYASGEMLSSIQTGLKALSKKVNAALICLGDQPQVEPEVVQQILQKYSEKPKLLVVPSYQMRRGHPWLVDRSLWVDILKIKPPKSTRDFLNSHVSEIVYIPVNTSSVVEDMDIPEDYEKFKPKE